MIQIIANKKTNEKMWLMSNRDIEILTKDITPNKVGAPEYTVVKPIQIGQFMGINGLIAPQVDMFMQCPNPDLHVHYDCKHGERIIVTMRVRPRDAIEELMNQEDYPMGASIPIAFMELIMMTKEGNIGNICVAPINMTCDSMPMPLIYVGAISLPNDKEFNDLCQQYAFSHGTLDISNIYKDRVEQLHIWKQLMDQGLLIWTGVQYALAHPAIMEFSRKDSNRMAETEIKSPAYKRDQKFKVCGMRKLYIDGALMGFVHHKKTRKTASWFVHGHWRCLQNGKKIWIDGYWKGPDRENPDLETKREVVIADGA